MIDSTTVLETPFPKSSGYGRDFRSGLGRLADSSLADSLRFFKVFFSVTSHKCRDGSPR